MATRIDYKISLAQCGDILMMLDDLQTARMDNSDAYNFAESVRSKVLGIADYLRKNEMCTQKQLNALDNMQAGVEKWLN